VVCPFGRPSPFADGQIAAIAAVNGLILVTFNRGDFEGFDGLQMQDWRDPDLLK
jgi:tRNA(fMet)-specific endonuclease VapC